MFKSTILYEPYFYIACRKGQEGQVEEWLLRKYEGLITRLERCQKEDLKLVRFSLTSLHVRTLTA